MSGKLGISSDSNKTSGLNPEVWGPHYWFFFAHDYPELPALSQRCYEKKILRINKQPPAVYSRGIHCYGL